MTSAIVIAGDLRDYCRRPARLLPETAQLLREACAMRGVDGAAGKLC